MIPGQLCANIFNAETQQASARIDHLALMMAGLQNLITLIGLRLTGGMRMAYTVIGGILTAGVLAVSVVDPFSRHSLLTSQ